MFKISHQHISPLNTMCPNTICPTTVSIHFSFSNCFHALLPPRIGQRFCILMHAYVGGWPNPLQPRMRTIVEICQGRLSIHIAPTLKYGCQAGCIQMRAQGQSGWNWVVGMNTVVFYISTVDDLNISRSSWYIDPIFIFHWCTSIYFFSPGREGYWLVESEQPWKK